MWRHIENTAAFEEREERDRSMLIEANGLCNIAMGDKVQLSKKDTPESGPSYILSCAWDWQHQALSICVSFLCGPLFDGLISRLVLSMVCHDWSDQWRFRHLEAGGDL